MHLILTGWPVPAARPAGVSPPALRRKQQQRQKPNRDICRPVCPKAAELAVTMDEVEIMVPNRADISIHPVSTAAKKSPGLYVLGWSFWLTFGRRLA